MKFLNYILNGYSRVLSVDAEFLTDSTGTIPQRVLCIVFKDIRTGDDFKYWVDGQKQIPHFFDYENCLLVSFMAAAEHGVFLNLLHGQPNNMFDCFVENKCLYGPFLAKNKTGLVDTCSRYNIPSISKEQKDRELDLILRRNEYEGKPFDYSLEEQQRIMTYCKSDVEETAELFIAQVNDIEKKNNLKTNEDFNKKLWEICFRGYSQGSVAKIERNGIPGDKKLINDFRENWQFVKDTIIQRHNKKLNVYTEDNKLNKKLFNKLVLKCGLGNKWPLLKSGDYTSKDDIVKRFEEHSPLIKEFRQLNKLNNLTRLGFFTPSEDGRLRCSLNGFGSITSRSQPSSSKNPLGAGKWARNFIKPGWGHELFYLDYKAQEPAIQGYLSGDPVLMEAYNTHDIYITTAQKLGMINDPNATKATHKVQRDVVKELFLANTYGMGERQVAIRLDCSRLKARHYLTKFKELYKGYFTARENWINGSAITGHLRSPLGWQRWILGNKKWKDGKRVSITNQLKNFIIQTTGADILRKACQKLLDNHIKVVSTLHDAVLIEVFKGDLEQKDLAKDLMELAAKEVVGGIIKVDEERITGNWIQEDKHQEIFKEIFREIENYKNNQGTNDQTLRVLSTG
jgi:DNA polymerase-1|tara:strand:- start:1487 stop:3361 length:1875 start_codon:yes stop_codon:yes gene_type:complete